MLLLSVDTRIGVGVCYFRMLLGYIVSGLAGSSTDCYTKKSDASGAERRRDLGKGRTRAREYSFLCESLNLKKS